MTGRGKRIRTSGPCLPKTGPKAGFGINPAFLALKPGKLNGNKLPVLLDFTGNTPDEKDASIQGTSQGRQRKTAGRAATLPSGQFHSCAATSSFYGIAESRASENVRGGAK